MTHLEIQHTDDGSATLFVPEKQPEILRATKAELGRLRETPFFSYFE